MEFNGTSIKKVPIEHVNIPAQISAPKIEFRLEHILPKHWYNI